MYTPTKVFGNSDGMSSGSDRRHGSNPAGDGGGGGGGAQSSSGIRHGDGIAMRPRGGADM